MSLIKQPPQPRGHYDSDKLARICTTWTRTDQTCPDCGSPIMRGSCDGRADRFACSGCVAVFVEGGE